MTNEIDAKTKLLCLLADPAEHSASPKMYNAAFEKLGLNMVYMAFQVNKRNLAGAIQGFKSLNMLGGNVSMPNKQEVIQYLDWVDPAAQWIGAVNCIVNQDGCLKGYNTDGIGFYQYLKAMGHSLTGKTMTLLGIGGAGTAIAVQGAMVGLSKLNIFNRQGKNWKRANDLISRISKMYPCKIELFDFDDQAILKLAIHQSDYLTNATNIGMSSNKGQSLISEGSYFKKDLVVVDTIYEPEKTRLIEQAEANGLVAYNGRGMLLYQGKENFKLWTGLELP